MKSLGYSILNGQAVVPSVSALIDAATIAVDASLANEFTVTLGGNRTVAAPSNPVNGQIIVFSLTQDSTGTRTVTWTSGAGGYSFGGSSTPILSTAAGDLDQVAFRYCLAKDRWLYQGSALGF